VKSPLRDIIPLRSWFAVGRTRRKATIEIRTNLLPLPAARLRWLLASTCIVATPAAADWLGTVSTDWFTAGNWNPAAVPGSGTAVIINNAGTPATINAPGAVAGAVTVGNGTGQSGMLNISAGGVLTSAASNLAYDPNTTGTATVTGAGAVWNSNSLDLGMDAGAVGQLNVLNGGKVSTGRMYLGYGNGGTGASGTVLVSGNGSSFTSSGFVYAGYGGTGTITVTGAGASFSSGTFGIGYMSYGGVSGNGTFNLQNGATASSGSVTIGNATATSGAANISGSGTIWTTGGMTVGGAGAGALNITAGGKVENFGGVSIGDQVVVSGPNSQLIISGNATTGVYSPIALGLGVLGASRPSSLLIENGGKVTIQNTATATTGSEADFRIGRTTATATVTVTGAQSALSTPYDMLVGDATNSNGIVNVTNGGTLTTGHAAIASGVNSTGSVTVTGTNSVWTISDSNKTTSGQGLFLGLPSGSAGTLTIADGGVVNVNSTGRGVSAGTNSVINIGTGGAAGTLNANSVSLEGGTSQINFNHNSTNYIFAASIIDSPPFSPNPNTATVNFLAGTTILTGQNANPNSFSGKINISSGATAQFGNGGADGLIKGDVANNGAMIVKLSSLFESYGGVISGNGTFEQAGTGTLALTGNNTYSGLTKVTSGTLKIGDGGTTGSVAGNIQNNSELAFDRSDNFTFSNLISGTGRLTKDGAGTMTLTAANTYTGGTSVAEGTLKLDASDRLASTGSLFIFGNATFDLDNHSQTVGAFSSGLGTVAIGSGSLTFGNSLDREFQGNVTGSGSLIKQGTGTQIMSGNSSTYTGTTTINNGTMLVTGDLSNSATTANSSGTLGGTGTVGATTVNGAIAPGLANAIGTLNVKGTYTQALNSFYNVNVNAAGFSDLVNVTGAANINGGTVQVTSAIGSYNPSTVYTILTSTLARTGNFADVTSNFAFLDPTLTYDPNNVYLTLARNSIDFASIGITPNQISAGRGLETLGMGNPVVDAALVLTPEQARAAFDSVSGEIHPSLHALMLDESAVVRDTILGRQRLDTAQGWAGTFATGFAEEDEAALAYAKKARKIKGGPRWPVKAPPPVIGPLYGAWVQGYGNWTRLNSDGNAATLRASTGGAIGGVDVTLNHNWRFGIATGGGRTDARVDARGSSGTIDTFHLAAYGGGQMGDIMFRTGAAYSHHDITTTRTIAFPGFADTATANYGASTSQVFGEAAYRLHKSWLTTEAFGNLAYVRVNSDGFVESGGPAALSVAEANTSVTFTTLGLRAQAPIPALGPWLTTARGSLGWQHAYNHTAPTSLMSFASGSAPFAIAGVPIAADTLLVEAGLDAQIYRNTVLALLYTGRMASDASAHALKANLAVRF